MTEEETEAQGKKQTGGRVPCEVNMDTGVELSESKGAGLCCRRTPGVPKGRRMKPGELSSQLRGRQGDEEKETVWASVWVSLKGCCYSEVWEGLGGNGQEPGCE